MTDPERGGPLSENPRFETVSEPASYPHRADGPVRYTAIYVDDQPVACLWAAADESAADVLPLSPAGYNAAVAWTERLRAAYADGLRPLEVLRHWAGKPLDPGDERSGVVHEGEEREAASLAELEALAAG